MTLILGQRLRLAGVLIFVGLLIEAWTLHWNSPIGFLVFLGIGGLFIGAGILIYLLALIALPAAQDSVRVMDTAEHQRST